MTKPNRIISRAPLARGKFLRPVALLSVAVLAACPPWRAAPARACDTPVYRYAMTNWQPDAFEAFVFHRGPLDAPAKAAMARLESVANGEVPINLVATAIDVDGRMAEPIGEIWQRQKPSRMPWLVVMPPLGHVPDEQSLHAGPLDASAVEALIDSPARQNIARRLRSGDAIVWVLLAGSDAGRNAAARAAVTAASEDVLKSYVPPDAAGASALSVGADTQSEGSTEGPPEAPLPPPRFSVVELSRTDPAEAMLRAMLMRSEPGLSGDTIQAGQSSQSRQPVRQAGPSELPIPVSCPPTTQVVAFPIFGRGRSLTGLVGPGITADSVTEVCNFLLGPCSCMVKESNPGVDLLIRTDWSLPAERPVDEPAPVTAGVAVAATTGTSGNLFRNILLAVAFIVAAAGAVALVARRRGRRS